MKTSLFRCLPVFVFTLLLVWPWLVQADCTPTPSGLVGWWAGEGNALDSAGTNNGTLEGGIIFGTGEVGQAFLFNSTSAYVKVPASPSLNVTNTGLNGGFTIEGWINPSDVSQNHPIVEWNNGTGTLGVQFYINPASLNAGPGTLYANIVENVLGLGYYTKSHEICTAAYAITTNVFQHVALTYDPFFGNATIYCNGLVVTQQNLGWMIVQTTYDVYLGGSAGANTFAGLMDEMSIYNRALSSSEIAAIYAAGSAGKCGLSPVIYSQPANQTVTVADTATFNVTASGTRPLSYQWSFNGTNLIGATNTTLTLTNIQLSQAGNYTVLVTNSFGSVLSSNAVLTVNNGISPSIITQPTNQTIVVGGTVNFSVIASGTLPLSYQWNYNGTNIVGATNTTLTLTNVQLSQAGSYAVLATNLFGSALSSNAVLLRSA